MLLGNAKMIHNNAQQEFKSNAKALWLIVIDYFCS